MDLNPGGASGRSAPTGPAVAPLLVFGWGNRSRGDDALGPLAVERLRALPHDPAHVEFIDDYQLMVEHVLDLQQRDRVLFVDASRRGPTPFEASAVEAAPDVSSSTHALSPQALLHVYANVLDRVPPPCTLLAIRGETFELGATPSLAALAHLDAAVRWAQDWLAGALEACRGVAASA